MDLSKHIIFIRSIVLSALLLASLAACASPPAERCPVTAANGSTPPGETPSELYHGNGQLWTVLWPEGTITFAPDTAGEIRDDGSLAMKFPWWRGDGVSGSLEIEGRSLDGSAAPLGSSIPEGYGDTGFQASTIIFPEAGCWEVTGRAGAAELTFVVQAQVSAE